MIRNPVVAGQFYAGSADSLLKEIKGLMGAKADEKKEDCLGAVSPHAGYVYSGGVAGRVFAAMKPKPIYIVMGPNHTGMGGPFGMATHKSWKTPLGIANVDKALADAIHKKRPDLIKYDDLPHAYEHSVEVQLPFLQFLQETFEFVPIVIAHEKLSRCREAAEVIAESVKELKLIGRVAIVASSDMTHYEPHEVAKKKDSVAIESILALDEERLLKDIEELDISMCGYAPTAVMLSASKKLGANTARLVEYRTSGEASGDYSSVVGYAGIIVYKK